MKTSSKNKNKKKVKIFKKKKKINEVDCIKELEEKYNDIDSSKIKKFNDFPLSKQTLKGLNENKYIYPTEIQKESIGLCLKGLDVLGAAVTGSGKTLAFLVPVLEKLYCKQWTGLDGLGALIITPTRELAYQIFEVLRKIGHYHDFSAGLIIGGKDLNFEKKRMDNCNIIICTPGRLLQHMDENPLFNVSNLQIFILDEADRCLDMGFERTLNAIIENLPPVRQTILFSATQTKSVKDLARLSLKDPMYVSVHEKQTTTTPSQLTQSYIVCDISEKFSVLWSFIKTHLKQKSIIFLSSCKQVKYVYEMFCKLRPGVSLLALYGKLHQLKRMKIYDDFCKKSNAVLFATDLAARGLDFPEVNWVFQLDCPENVTTYIHRVGRTARYKKGGESILVLLPSELKMIKLLINAKIPIEQIKINPQKIMNPIKKIEGFLAHSPSLKESAQRAFVAYLKSIYFMSDKSVFQLDQINTDNFAYSLGLAIPPKIRFLKKINKNNTKLEHTNEENAISESNDSENESEKDDLNETKPNKVKTTNLSFDLPVQDDLDDDLLKVKRVNHEIDSPSDDDQELNKSREIKKNKVLTKVALAKRLLKKKIKPNKKLTFNEEGEVKTLNGLTPLIKEKQSDLAKEYENENDGGINIEKAKLVLREEDKYDKQLFKQKVKEKHRKQKLKLKQEKAEEMDDFGDDSESDEPDLSWLPDPDQIYGEKNDSDENRSSENDSDSSNNNLDSVKIKNNSSESENSSVAEQRNEIKNKRKRKEFKKNENFDYFSDDENELYGTKKNKSNKKSKLIEKVKNNLSVDEAEELALQLLRKN